MRSQFGLGCGILFLALVAPACAHRPANTNSSAAVYEPSSPEEFAAVAGVLRRLLPSLAPEQAVVCVGVYPAESKPMMDAAARLIRESAAGRKVEPLSKCPPRYRSFPLSVGLPPEPPGYVDPISLHIAGVSAMLPDSAVAVVRVMHAGSGAEYRCISRPAGREWKATCSKVRRFLI